MGIVSWLIWGFLVGLFARGLRPGRQAIGCWWTIALGIVGSLLGVWEGYEGRRPAR